MLRFISYYPMNSFLKTELEFDDEKISESFKSLMAEGKREIQYSDIAIIEFAKRADARWASTGFLISFLSMLLVAALYQIPALCGNPVIRGIGQTFFLAGVALCIPGYVKREYCYFFNINRDYVAGIAINKKNRKDVDKAVELIKTRTPILSETGPGLIDTVENPKFELTARFSPLYFYKNITRFYDNRVVDVEKSLLEDSVSEYKYDSLTQKISVAKYGDTRWNSVAFLLFGIGGFIFMGFALFLPGLIPTIVVMIVLGMLGIIPACMQYIKNEVVSFYDKNDSVILWTRIPRGEKQKVEEIIQFVKEKVANASET